MAELTITSLENLERIGDNVNDLTMRGVTIDTLPNLSNLINIEILRLDECEIKTIGELPPNLIGFSIGNNNSLTNLPQLPESLKAIRISYTSLRELPQLPQNLEDLSLTAASLRELPQLPQNLRTLRLADTSLRELPQLPPTLVKLNCYNNPLLTNIPVLPEGLKILQIQDSQLITRLPRLPESLTELLIGDPLISIENLPIGLKNISLGITPNNVDNLDLESFKILRNFTKNSPINL